MTAPAIDVIQDVLDVRSAAILSGDFDALVCTYSFPYRRKLLNTDVLVENAGEMWQSVSAIRHTLFGLGVNQFICLATDADYLTDRYIEVHYVTHCLRNAQPMLPSFTNRAVYARKPKGWKLCELQNDITVTQGWPHAPLRVSAVPVNTTHPKDDIRRSAADPMTLYQAFLDRFTATTRTRDFAAFCDCCEFPYTSHKTNDDVVLRCPEDTRYFFDVISGYLDGQQADTLIRTAKRAEFMGPDLICGYHTSQYTKDGAPVADPIRSRMILKRRATTWRLQSVANSLCHNVYPSNVPQSNGALPSPVEITERNRV